MNRDILKFACAALVILALLLAAEFVLQCKHNDDCWGYFTEQEHH